MWTALHALKIVCQQIVLADDQKQLYKRGGIMAKYNLEYTGEKINDLLKRADSLPGDIVELLQSFLCSDKYNVPTITKDEGTSKYIFTLPYEIGKYEVGKLVYIKCVKYGTVSEFTKPDINIGGVGNVLVDGTLKAGKNYNLMYDGSKFQVQLSTMGLSGESIAFTASGVYTIDTDFDYDIIVVGGGGAGAYYGYGSSGFGRGGGGGITTGVLKPTSNKLSVTIGAGGKAKSYDIGEANYGTGGGMSSADVFSAPGGTGGTADYGKGTNGTTGTNGILEGYYYNGTYYGKGGEASSTGHGTQGIVIITPIIN